MFINQQGHDRIRIQWDCHNRIYRNIICTDNNMDGKLRNELIWNYITIKEEFNLEN
jgi:hypothetical protein